MLLMGLDEIIVFNLKKVILLLHGKPIFLFLLLMEEYYRLDEIVVFDLKKSDTIVTWKIDFS